MSAKIPATVITGFLGAGKTTIIRHLVENANGKRIALIINEFGDLGVDGEILKGCGIDGCADDDVVELSNGCICCTVAEDFLPAIQKLVDREDAPDHIVIETSGLALPQPLVRAFNWPDIRTRVTVDGVVAVVDGPALDAGQFAHDVDAVDAQRRADDGLEHETPLAELFDDQLACADLVIVSKADLLQAGDVNTLTDRLGREIRRGVGVITSANGTVDPKLLLGMDVAAETDMKDRHEIHHHHHHDEDDDHDHDHGHDAFDSIVVDLPEVVNPTAVIERVREVSAAHGLFRVKGFVAVSGKPMRLVLQAVGPRVDTYFDRPFAVGEPRASRLVVIGNAGLDADRIRAELAA